MTRPVLKRSTRPNPSRCAATLAAHLVSASLVAIFSAATAQELPAEASAGDAERARGDGEAPAALDITPALLALRLLDQHGAPADVVTAFEHYPREVQTNPQAAIIYARALHALNRPEDARNALRSALAANPDNARLRAELARSLFEARLDSAARTQFELALATGSSAALSESERSAVNDYLTAIDQRRAWIGRASLALAPDSNIYAATSAEEVELFGLPFELDEASQQQSGLGLQYTLGATGRFGGLGFAPGFWRVDADLYGVDHAGVLFDQARIGVQAGPHIVVGRRLEFGFDLLGEKRWRSGADYSTAFGAETNLFARIDERLSVRTAIAVRESDERIGDRRDGWLTNLDVSASRRGAPDRLVNGRLYLQRGDLQADAESFWFGYVSAGAYRELRGGIGVYVEPYLTYRRHDAPDPFFATRRIDQEYGLQVRSTKRDWTVFDAAPYVALSLSSRSSTIPFYDDADRVRAEFGFTRTF